MPLTIVTGGGRGIGAATALQLARAGHDVVVNYRRRSENANRVVAAAREAGVRAVAVAADVTDPSDVDRLFAAGAELGPVTGLVNSAGLTQHIGDLADTPVEVIVLKSREELLREYEADMKAWWAQPLPPNFQPQGRQWKREDCYERRR